MAQIEIATGATVTNTAPNWADEISAEPNRLSYSVPPPPPNRHIDTSSIIVPETATQFVKFGESRGIRSITDRTRLLRLFNDFKGSSGDDDNRAEFSRVLFEMSRNQKLIRVIDGKIIEWCCNSGGYSPPPRHVSSARPIDRSRDTRDRDFNRPERTRDNNTRDRDFNRPERTRDNYEREDYGVRHERPQVARDTRPRDFNRSERTRDNYERDYVRHERPRDNEDPHRRIGELMRTIQSMEQTMERMQDRLDSLSHQV